MTAPEGCYPYALCNCPEQPRAHAAHVTAPEVDTASAHDATARYLALDCPACMAMDGATVDAIAAAHRAAVATPPATVTLDRAVVVDLLELFADREGATDQFMRGWQAAMSAIAAEGREVALRDALRSTS